MSPELSDFGRKLSAPSGIGELMEDLGRAPSVRPDIIMMGGGNPAMIPEVQAVWRRRMEEILAAPGEFEAMLGSYDVPRGNLRFIETMAAFFNETCGWPVDAENIAITAGSQTGYFLLMNMLAGPGGGKFRKILFPLVPEYIGYADQGVADEIFVACRPRIKHPAGHRFKYRIDFDALAIDDDTAAICLSRPTNPSANLVGDDEVRRLSELAAQRGVYLMIDNAYGAPFPNIVFEPAEPMWEQHIINTFSLSKLGLPATRTGIVVAAKDVIARLSAMNAVVSLANSGIGQTITGPLFASGEILRICDEHIRPFYEGRSRKVLGWIDEALDGKVDYHVHVSEGAFFLWMWLPGLPIGDRELYERLKQRGVLVVPGSYFFPGLAEPWPHRHQCIRLSYGQDLDKVQRGVEILAEVIPR